MLIGTYSTTCHSKRVPTAQGILDFKLSVLLSFSIQIHTTIFSVDPKSQKYNGGTFDDTITEKAYS